MTDSIFNDVQPILFWIIAGLTAGSAIATVLTQNIVRAATWLLFALGGTSAIFFLLGADFVGATQLLVYVGGTLILVVFGVMLTAQGPFVTMKTGAAEWAVAVAAGIGLLTVLIISISLRFSDFPAKREELRSHVAGATPKQHDKSGLEKKQAAKSKKQYKPVVAKYAPKDLNSNLGSDPANAQSADVLGIGFLGKGVGPAHNVLDKDGNVKKDKDGNDIVVRTNYLLPFEIISVHLLVVLIGAAYLARAKRRHQGSKPNSSTAEGPQGA